MFAPLYKLLRKNVKFIWGPEQEKCFNNIKNMFKTQKILKTFDHKLPTAIESDASCEGIGSVLLQQYSDGWYPVQFASRSLNPAERNYSQIEREALSVIFGCEKFRKYILGNKIIIRNDHKPLLNLFAHDSGVPLNCSARLQRWKLRLSQYTYKFQYCKGIDNVNSDFLSRFPLNETSTVNEPYEVIFAINSLENMPITCEDIKNVTNKDKILCVLKQYIRTGFPCNVIPELSSFKNMSKELSIVNECIMFRNRVFIPESLRNAVLNQLHEFHPGISGMKSLCRSLIWYQGIENDIINLVKNCKQCVNQLSRPPQNRSVEWPRPERKWSRLHVDHFFFEDHVFLVVVDSLTRYIECEIVKNTSARETINHLRDIFARNGLPDVIVSDNATSFTAFDFKEFLSKNCIKHITPAPYSPSSNGQAERSVRVIKDLLKKNTIGSLQNRLSNILLHYRNIPHSVTKQSPAVALNGRTYITIKERINPNNFPISNMNNKCKNIPVFQIGEKVHALNLRDGPKWLEATVVERLGINLYNVLISEYDVIWKRHVHQLLRALDYRDATTSYAPQANSNLDVDKKISYKPFSEINIPENKEDDNGSTPLINNDDNQDANNENQNETATDSSNEKSVTIEPRRSTRIRKPVNRYEP